MFSSLCYQGEGDTALPNWLFSQLPTNQSYKHQRKVKPPSLASATTFISCSSSKELRIAYVLPPFPFSFLPSYLSLKRFPMAERLKWLLETVAQVNDEILTISFYTILFLGWDCEVWWMLGHSLLRPIYLQHRRHSQLFRLHTWWNRHSGQDAKED